MGLDRVLTHVEPSCDLGVRFCPGDQLEDLQLTRRQLINAIDARPDRRTHGCETLDESPGHRGCQESFRSAPDLANRGQELFRAQVLEKEPAGPGPDRPVGLFVNVEGGQDQHPGTDASRGSDDPTGGLDAVEPRHSDVH